MLRDGDWLLAAYTTTTPASCSQRNQLVSIPIRNREVNAHYAQVALQEPPSIPPEDSHQTLASLSPSSRLQPPSQEIPSASPTPTESSPPSIDPKAPSPDSESNPEEQSPQDLEDDAASQGAFNEETGEINWDCPCLGGMAHGPCGEEFRAAFSCFVYSKEEPKGMDCIDRFKGMQDCFRSHPEIYGAELDDDEQEMEGISPGEEGSTVVGAMPEDAPGIAAANASRSEEPAATPRADTSSATTRDDPEPKGESSTADAANEKGSIYDSEPERGSDPDPQTKGKLGKLISDRGAAKSSAVQGNEEDDLVPKAAHDATEEAPKTEK